MQVQGDRENDAFSKNAASQSKNPYKTNQVTDFIKDGNPSDTDLQLKHVLMSSSNCIIEINESVCNDFAEHKRRIYKSKNLFLSHVAKR